MNKVMLIGNVGAEPQVRYLDTGICVAQVRLATTERGYTLPNGTQVPDRTEWHNVVFWRKLGETVEKYVHKGDKLYVEGKIQSRTYDDRQGVRHQIVEIMADNMEMLTPRREGSPVALGSAQQPAANQPAVSAQTVSSPQENNDEMPF